MKKPNQVYRENYVPSNLRISLLSVSLLTLLFIINISQGYAQSRQEPGSIAARQPVVATSVPVPIPPEGLKIGEKIPAKLWHLPLRVVNHPQGKRVITLDDYRGKLIILDFWATTCGGCVAAMPKLQSLQKQLGSQIQILPVSNYDDAARTITFLKNNIKMQGVDFPFVVGDTILNRLFPSTILSHLAWIGPNGSVVAITSSQFVIETNIQKALKGTLDLPVKNDNLQYDKNKALLIEDNGAPEDAYQYRSVITRYLPGLPSIRHIDGDSVKGTVRLHCTNMTVADLYYAAFRGSPAFIPSRLMLKVSNPETYFHNANFSKRSPGELLKWREANLYSYELTIPIDQAEKMSQYVLQDLNRYFGLKGEVKRTKTRCLLLVQYDEFRTQALSTEGGNPRHDLNENGICEMQNVPLRYLTGYLNFVPDMPPVLDETGYQQKVDLDIDLSGNIESIRGQLKSYGLDLKEAIRELDIFVLTKDKNFSDATETP